VALWKYIICEQRYCVGRLTGSTKPVNRDIAWRGWVEINTVGTVAWFGEAKLMYINCEKRYCVGRLRAST